MKKRLCTSLPLLRLPANILIHLSLTKRWFENAVIKPWKWSASHWSPHTHDSPGNPATRIYTAILCALTPPTQDLTPRCSFVKPWAPLCLSFIKFSVTVREELSQCWRHQSEVPLSYRQPLTLLTFSFQVNIPGETETLWVYHLLLLMQFQNLFSPFLPAYYFPVHDRTTMYILELQVKQIVFFLGMHLWTNCVLLSWISCIL